MFIVFPSRRMDVEKFYPTSLDVGVEEAGEGTTDLL
jgi:hypothetical protein